MLKAISRRSLFLFLFDCAGIIAAYYLALSLRGGEVPTQLVNIPPFLYLSFVILPAVFYIFDLYYPFKYFTRAQTLVDVLLALTVGTVLLAAFSYLDRTLLVSRLIFVYMATFLLPLVYLVRLFYDVFFRSHVLDKKALIVGTGPLAREMVKAIGDVPHSGIEVIGMVSETRGKKKTSRLGAPVIGNTQNLLSLIDWYNIDIIVLAVDPKQRVSEAKIMAELMMRKVIVASAIHLFEKITGEIPCHLLDDHYLLNLMSQVRMKPFLRLKRLLDIAASFSLLVILFPVMLASVLILSLSEPRQIFFKQKRIGRDSKIFELLKLRTMAPAKDGKKAVTAFGRWLRKYRIDEVPQLINVLKGDMSLIGPRPEVPYFVNRSRKKIPFYDAVFAVKPGLTGWAQVNLPHVTTVKDYEKKFYYNVYYLKNISITLDLVIFVRTFRVVLFGKGT